MLAYIIHQIVNDAAHHYYSFNKMAPVARPYHGHSLKRFSLNGASRRPTACLGQNQPQSPQYRGKLKAVTA